MKVFTDIYEENDRWVGLVTGGAHVHEKILVIVFGDSRQQAEKRLQQEMKIGSYERI